MNCTYCGFFNEEPTETCERCGAAMAEPTCSQCGTDVGWGEAICDRCEKLSKSADRTPCPSCGGLNSVSAEYCTSCGSPMAVITRVMTLSRAREREPLETWRVYGIETTMVGREAEIDRLYQLYESVVDEGVTRLAAVTGATGLGKSRLFAEFQRQLNEEMSEAHVLQGASRDDTGAPYSMFTRMLKDRFYIGTDEHADSARRKLLEAVRAIVRDEDESERLAHLVGELMGLHFEDSPHVPTVRDSEGATELDRRSFEAVVEVLRADADANPLIVILEDLQYATDQSLNLIEFMAEELEDAPILLVLSWNSEELVSGRVLLDLDYVDDIELALLSDAEVAEFVRDTLHKADDVPNGLVEKITDNAHGNPLSVEEMLRILISQGVIDTRSQTWLIHEDKLDEVELPSTVEGAVQARLNALTDDERRVLGMASCIGGSFWPELVRCLYHLHEEHVADNTLHWADAAVDERVEEIMESLERKDMIRRENQAQDDDVSSDDEEMHFKHRIERESIYETLPSQEKQRYHRLIAQWLERRFADSVSNAAETIAIHYDRARCLDHAARKYLEAANDARRRYQNEKAKDLYIKGLSYLSDADIDLKLKAFHDLGTVFDIVGEYDQSLAYFREMLRYSWILNDEAKGGVAYNKIGRAYRSLGEYDLALENLERALEFFREVDDTRGIASTLDDIGKIEWIRGNFDEALRFYRAGLHLRREMGDERSIALSLNHVGTLKLQRGELKESVVYFREALDLRRSVDDKQGVVDSYNSLGILCMERGDVDGAQGLFEDALKLARRIGYRGAEGIMLNNLGEIHLSQGNLEEARDHLEEAMRVAEDSSEKRVLFDILRNLGRLALREADRQTALDRINEALAIANQLDSQQLIGMGMQSLAHVHAHHVFDDELREESLALAEECFADAIDILRGVGNEAELGRCLSAYGQFLLEQGDEVRGRKNLEQAGEIFERLEMRKLWDATQSVLKAI